MFRNSNFNGDLSNWTFTSATYMGQMFKNATSFTGTGLDSWTLPSDGAINLSLQGMFQGTNQNITTIGSWNTTRVTDMAYMFDSNSSFNTDISSWDLSNSLTTQLMFSGASAFNQDITIWDVSNVTDMRQMFLNASSFDQNIRKWNTSSVTSGSNYDNMFNGATAMDATYNGVTGFGTTPTAAFFNQSITITWTGVDNGTSLRVPLSGLTGTPCSRS